MQRLLELADRLEAGPSSYEQRDIAGELRKIAAKLSTPAPKAAPPPVETPVEAPPDVRRQTKVSPAPAVRKESLRRNKR